MTDSDLALICEYRDRLRTETGETRDQTLREIRRLEARLDIRIVLPCMDVHAGRGISENPGSESNRRSNKEGG